MKICFLTRNVFGLGGIERVTSILANELIKEHDIHIWCLEGERIESHRENLYIFNEKIQFKDFNIKKRKDSKSILRFINTRTNIFNKSKYNKALSKAYFNNSEKQNFINKIKEENYDFIISTSYHYNILLGMTKKYINAKTIAWQHATYYTLFETEKMAMWNQEKLAKECMSYLDEIVVLTELDKKNYYEKLNLKTNIIPNPVSFKSKEKANMKNKNIIYVGRLEWDKQPEIILDVFNNICNECKGWKLIFVGDGSELNSLKVKAEKLGIEDLVEFVGKQNNVLEYYLRASIFINTSIWENFSLSIIEAMECGIPVIAFDNQGPREIINSNGKNGVLIANQDSKIMEKELLNLIRNEEKRKEISINGLERVKDFYIENIMKEWEKIF